MELNPFGVFGKKEPQKKDNAAKPAASDSQIQAFQAVLNHADEDKGGSARTTLGQLKQVEAIDLQLEEKQMVMKHMDKALQDETAAKPALAALTPASTLPTRPMVPNLQANA